MKGQIELIILTIQITNEYWEINIEIMDEVDEDSWKSVIDFGPFSIKIKPNPQETRIITKRFRDSMLRNPLGSEASYRRRPRVSCQRKVIHTFELMFDIHKIV